MDTAVAEPWSKFVTPRITSERRQDGSVLIRVTDALGPYEQRVGDVLLRQSGTIPDRIHLAARNKNGGWCRVSYGESARLARAIGQALLDRGLGPEKPILIVAENGIDFALLGLGASLVGIPFAPISAAYVRAGQGLSKLRHVAETIQPGLIFVDSAARYEAGRDVFESMQSEIVLGEDAAAHRLTPFSSLADTQPTRIVDLAAERVEPDTILKILFTSGSTGLPKGVINTHRMICVNQAMIQHDWPFLRERPPVLLDWLPWSHTFGGNFNFYMILWNGGTYYIDQGKPAPGLIEGTIANLRELSPTMILNVPAGFALMLDYLEKDIALSERLFANLDFMFYAAAAMAEPLQRRIRSLAQRTAGREIPLISAWGTTETAPLATGMNFPTRHTGNIGVPVLGCEIKLAPVGDKLEIRVRGPNVTPGYWRRPDLTTAAFDGEGFYCTGDAVRFANQDDPREGILFDGRIAENFKLSTGTWVHVGQLRLAAIAACAPVVQDCVIAGHDRDEICALLFPSLMGCRSLCTGLAPDAPLGALIEHPSVRTCIEKGLEKLALSGAGSSMRIARALLLVDPPTVDSGEITDKGYINQAAVLKARASQVERLFASVSDSDVIRCPR